MKKTAHAISLTCLVLAALTTENFAIGAELSAQQKTEANRSEARLNSGTTLIKDEQLDAYLATIVQRIAATDPAAAAAGFRLHALRGTAPYAFSLDNGASYVSSGLLARLQNESQLAAIVVAEMAPIVRQDTAVSSEITQRRARQSAIPNIILVSITAGLAAIPLTKSEVRAQDQLDAQLRLESDRLALTWLQKAGFDASEAPRAFQRLIDTLQAEQRLDSGFLSSRTNLEERIASVSKGMPELAAASSTPTDGSVAFRRRFALELLRSDLESAKSVSFDAVADRLENDFGVDGESTFLRAEHLRLAMTTDAQLPDTIHAYEVCVGFQNAPPEAMRELAFLYRKQGDTVKARQFFDGYLQKNPGAADAPIIRSYRERL